MAGETDFHKLYAELGLAPGCDLRALTLAYRRRVQELHPDRRLDAPDADADERLRTLIALHGAAQEFHRRYGRLPGASLPLSAASPPPAPESLRTVAPSSARASRSWTALLALPLIGVLSWLFWDSSQAPTVDSDSGAVASASVRANVGAHELALGMDPDSVLGIQGQPPLDLGDRWEYGPSFVRFEHRRLVDWYSSPLRPLKTSTPRPLPVTPAPTLH